MSKKLYIIEDVHAIDARHSISKDMVGTVVSVVEESIAPVYIQACILKGYVSCKSWQRPFSAWYGETNKNEPERSAFHMAIKIKPLQQV